jgi:hypothetical protein
MPEAISSKEEFKRGTNCFGTNGVLFPLLELQFFRGELHFDLLLSQCTALETYFQRLLRSFLFTGYGWFMHMHIEESCFTVTLTQ